MRKNLSGLQTWKSILWLSVGCYGLYCGWLLFDAYSQTLASNTELLNSLYFPHYLAFMLLLVHAVTTTIIYRTLSEE